MRFTPKSLLCSALLLVTGFTCYFVGKRSVRYPKPTALDCAFYKMESYVTPDRGAEVVLGTESPKGCVESKKCEPTGYWLICDDGFVRFGKALIDNNLKVRVCGTHGAVDNRQIHTSATLGKNWKVVVTPINPTPSDFEDAWQANPISCDPTWNKDGKPVCAVAPEEKQ